MSPVTVNVFFSLAALLILGISYWYRRSTRPKIPFHFWWLAQINCIIAIVGVGLAQTHFGCTSLWGDCYVRNYPYWLADYKPFLLHAITIWWVLAIAATAVNVIKKHREFD